MLWAEGLEAYVWVWAPGRTGVEQDIPLLVPSVSAESGPASAPVTWCGPSVGLYPCPWWMPRRGERYGVLSREAVFLRFLLPASLVRQFHILTRSVGYGFLFRAPVPTALLTAV